MFSSCATHRAEQTKDFFSVSEYIELSNHEIKITFDANFETVEMVVLII